MQSLLIANRGEIACRILRTAKRRGLRTIAVYSEADARSQHVLLADTAVCIGPSAAALSYLDIDRIMAAARTSDADAIHPGYGFLSENPALVDACESAGIVFVGPGSAAMRAMGLKDAAKRLMADAGVPVVPGYHGKSQDSSLLQAEALAIGYPVLIKARAGGGGKGMRRVESPAQFVDALAAAQREAQASFGDAHVLIEQYVAAPRHIEVQVFGDSQGNVVHLFERDCSLQRRHQKVVEEAPAPGMSAEVRQAMTEAAVRAARAIDYRGAGTVEFIVDGSRGLRTDGFWFMEMNTRLQVEHPVTEAITGVDLVDWQLRVAAGEPLPMRQEELKITGHAVEARLYAENPATGFLPAVGTLARFHLSPAARIDSGVVEGDEISPYYDPLLAKMIAHAPERRMAFNALSRQLAESVVLGTTTNREFLWRLLSQEKVVRGVFDTGFIEAELAGLLTRRYEHELIAAAALELVSANARSVEATAMGSVALRLGIWQLWGEASRQVLLKVDGQTRLCELQAIGSHRSHREWCVRCPSLAGFPDAGIRLRRLDESRLSVNGIDLFCECCLLGDELFIQLGPEGAVFGVNVPGEQVRAGPAADTVLSPMPGRIVAIRCSTGDRIRAGQALIIMEAMKMEQVLCCERDGVVESISVRVDEQISQGVEVLRLERASP